ncbi:MAG: response regulator [Chromatiales bacterium]|nr:response regulator [Chromatiales bacterium]
MSELLMGTRLDAEQRGYVETLTRAGRRLQDVIRDVLDLTRIETDQIRLADLEFSLLEAIEEVLAAAAEHAEDAGLELAGDLAPDLPWRVRGDPGRFKRLLRYLIEDLIDLTAAGELVVRALWSDGSVLRVEVHASQTAGFRRPAGSEGAWTGGAAGSGLGLTVARAWVERMGGRLLCEPPVLDGALAWIELPLTAVSPGRPLQRPAASLAGRRALLVAPEGPTAGVLEARLNELGLSVTRCGEAETARTTARAAADVLAPFAVLLVDARIKGLEPLLSERSVEAEPALAMLQRLLLVPRRPGWRDEQAARLAVSARLTKPVTRADLLAALTGNGTESDPVESWRLEDAPSRASDSEGLGLRVLVADDNAINQDTVAAMLRSLGCESRIVFDGQAAIEALSRESFDLVLMDCKMPLMDGYEAARRIRLQEGEARIRLPIIALTAHAMDGDQERCRAAGMDDYLTKPLSRRALQAMLERWSPRRSAGTASGSGSEVVPGPMHHSSTGTRRLHGLADPGAGAARDRARARCRGGPGLGGALDRRFPRGRTRTECRDPLGPGDRAIRLPGRGRARPGGECRDARSGASGQAVRAPGTPARVGADAADARRGRRDA